MTCTSRAPLLALLLALSCACGPSLQGSMHPARLAAVRRVVIPPFTAPEGAPRSLSDSFADELSAELAGARFAVVDRTAPADATSVDAIVIGSVVAYRDQAVTPDVDTSLAISVRIVDTRTGEVILSTRSNATAAATFCSQEMTCLRGKMMTAIGRYIVDAVADR